MATLAALTGIAVGVLGTLGVYNIIKAFRYKAPIAVTEQRDDVNYERYYDNDGVV